MRKRYKEFLIDVLVKTYQIILGVAIIQPVVMKKIDLLIFILSVIVAGILIFWAGAISNRLEG